MRIKSLSFWKCEHTLLVQPRESSLHPLITILAAEFEGLKVQPKELLFKGRPMCRVVIVEMCVKAIGDSDLQDLESTYL